MLLKFAHHFVPNLFLDSSFVSPAAYKAAVKDPDIFTYDEAMDDVEHLEEWKAAMHKEISQLEALRCWDEVDISDAKTRITIPRTWVFKIKCSPNGEIKKYKARFCCRGDLQEDVFELFAPVVSWTSVRLFLVLMAILGWNTCSLDFTNAFIQATLPSPVWLHLP